MMVGGLGGLQKSDRMGGEEGRKQVKLNLAALFFFFTLPLSAEVRGFWKKTRLFILVDAFIYLGEK